MLRTILLFVALGIAALLCIGCSESTQGTSAATKGSAQLTIKWPTRSRMIPVAANYIYVSFTQGTTVVYYQWITRPETGGTSQTISFPSLPLGAMTAKASAFFSEEMPAAPMATGSAPLTITADSTTTFSINMSSTIVALQLLPGSEVLTIGQTAQLSVRALDINGQTVLITPASLAWTNLNTTVVSLDPTTETITAVSPGTAYITVTDTESAASAQATISVSAPS